MATGRLLAPLAGAAFLFLTGTVLAQGYGTPNAPEAGPASPGAESHAGERSPDPRDGHESRLQADAPPPASAGTDADHEGGEPKR